MDIHEALQPLDFAVIVVYTARTHDHSVSDADGSGIFGPVAA